MTGVFITFEGIEGVGKSTQIQHTRKLLSAKHPDGVVVTREPGGTRTGEAIRSILLQANGGRIDGITETLLIFAARHQHIQEVIEPALNADKIVLCDRFTDATFAYQGGGRNIDTQLVAKLQDLVQGKLRPDLTLLLDAPEGVGLARIKGHRQDRFETETVNFFRRVRQAYLDRARQYPEKIQIIDASRTTEEVAQEIQSILTAKGLY